MRTPFTIQTRDESDPTLACGLLRARIPFAFQRDNWPGFTAYVKTDDAGEVREFARLLAAVQGTATDGNGTIYPEDAFPEPIRSLSGNAGPRGVAEDRVNTP